MTQKKTLNAFHKVSCQVIPCDQNYLTGLFSFQQPNCVYVIPELYRTNQNLFYLSRFPNLPISGNN
jgi:hypothetical protein